MLLDQECLVRRNLRPHPIRQPHPGVTRIPGWRIRHFLVSEVKMKIRISIPRNPFLSKKTEARATGVLESFFSSLDFHNIYTLFAGDLRRKRRRGRSGLGFQRAVAAAPQSRPCREVRRGSCWLTKLPKKLSGSQESEREPERRPRRGEVAAPRLE